MPNFFRAGAKLEDEETYKTSRQDKKILANCCPEALTDEGNVLYTMNLSLAILIAFVYSRHVSCICIYNFLTVKEPPPSTILIVL